MITYENKYYFHYVLNVIGITYCLIITSMILQSNLKMYDYNYMVIFFGLEVIFIEHSEVSLMTSQMVERSI